MKKLTRKKLLAIVKGAPYGDWIKVPKAEQYQHANDDSWEDSYNKLEVHHNAETDFLIKLCQQLAQELLNKETVK